MTDRQIEDSGSFGGVLRGLRERAGLSQSALARQAGLDPSFVNRLESGQRGADRGVVDALARGMGLDAAATDRLLAAGGYLPGVIARLGFDDPTLQLVAQILADERLPPADRTEFRQVVEAIGRRWRATEGR